MKMQKFKQLFAGMMIGALLCLSVLSYAGMEQIQVFFNNISLKVNGNLINTGNDSPFIYNGRTYVPARYVAEALGASVKWNETSNSVEIEGATTSQPNAQSSSLSPTNMPTPTFAPAPIAKKVEDMRNGSYVKFGKYNGSSLIWFVVDQNTIVSDKILCTKAFDAAHFNDTTASVNVQKYGSNKWTTSNLREWLNSDASPVAYSTQPPVAAALYMQLNPYVDEPGFLNGFTANEKSRLQKINHDGVFDAVFLLSESELSLLGDKRKMFNKVYSRYWTRTASSAVDFDVRVVGDKGDLYDSHAYTGSEGVMPAAKLAPDATVSGTGMVNDPYILN